MKQGAAGKPVLSPKIYRVAEITRLIKTLLEDEAGEVWVEGEISNFRQPTSGHWYFTLKDENAQIAAVMFRGSQRQAQLEPRDGQVARVFGLISVYEKSGQYQLVVRQLEAGGQGALQAAFEALKKKLAAEGLFDQARKKPIPALARHIGVVTSPTGAAIRDILNVLTRRYPNLHVVLAPARVQGAGAAAEIAAAIDDLNALRELDVLIIGRGGGSLEDLWCFNEECVARAIARSKIPVISAVGHETDFTISDFVADVRTPTPSAAAELAVGCKADFQERLDAHARRLARALRQAWRDLKSRFVAAAGSYVFREPGNLARRYLERLARQQAQLRHCLQAILRDRQQQADELSLRLARRIGEWKRICVLQVGCVESQLRSMNPLAVLDRGYSITYHADGRILKSAQQTRRGERLLTRLAQGKIESEVISHGGTEDGGKR